MMYTAHGMDIILLRMPCTHQFGAQYMMHFLKAGTVTLASLSTTAKSQLGDNNELRNVNWPCRP